MNDFFQIENRSGKLKLNEQVRKESIDKLIDELDKLYGKSAVSANMQIGDVFCSADDALDSVDVEINSPGGSVFEGQRLYNALREMSGRGVEVSTTVNGIAASMGSVILMAGDNRSMTHGSRIMIHEASTMAMGDARAMQKAADLLEGISSEIAGIYADRTDGDAAEIRKLMLAETWMTAEQSQKIGFIHNVIKDGKNVSASAEIDIQATTPTPNHMNLIERLKSPSSEESTERIAALENQISAHDVEIEDFKSKLELAEAALQEAAGFKTDIENLTAEVAAKVAEINSLQTEVTAHESTIDRLTVEVEDAKESSGKIASETLAAIGQPEPLATSETESEAVTGDLLAQYEKLEGVEKRDFLNLHAVELRRLAREKGIE